jgi:glycine C-acetyltransferase
MPDHLPQAGAPARNNGNMFEWVRGLRGKNALSRSAAHFAKPRGPNLLSRTGDYCRWRASQAEGLVWPYSRSVSGPPLPWVSIATESGEVATGINFASQDYLGLSQHPSIIEASIRAVREFGPHSAGSAVLLGNTSPSLALEAALGTLLKMPYIALFPTGWGAGFGAITALVRSEDHVVLDEFSHACLKQGAEAATKKIFRYPHLDNGAVREALQRIRNDDSKNGIMVVTEALFSMDSDSPDLRPLQNTCREYDAVLLVDIAHDLGAIGAHGGGVLESQGLLGQVDLVVGAFSKTLASNGGFLATTSTDVKQFVKMFAGPHIFSNALSPIQAAVVTEALRITTSEDGNERRRLLMAVVRELRHEFAERGARILGAPSAIVPFLVGSQKVLRVAARLIFERGVFANSIEFPAVAVGASRFRLQAMATHTPVHAREAAKTIVEAVGEANELLERMN